MGFKYYINPLSFKFTISSLSIFISIYISRVYLYIISLHFISLKRYILKHLGVLSFTKEDLLQISSTSLLSLLDTNYHLHCLWRIDQISKTK
jgi:hypothetical protein